MSEDMKIEDCAIPGYVHKPLTGIIKIDQHGHMTYQHIQGYHPSKDELNALLAKAVEKIKHENMGGVPG